MQGSLNMDGLTNSRNGRCRSWLGLYFPASTVIWRCGPMVWPRQHQQGGAVATSSDPLLRDPLGLGRRSPVLNATRQEPRQACPFRISLANAALRSCSSSIGLGVRWPWPQWHAPEQVEGDRGLGTHCRTPINSLAVSDHPPGRSTRLQRNWQGRLVND